MTNKSPIGLYVHIPFCKRKCPYCDFYSLVGNEARQTDYINAVLAHLSKVSVKCLADTLYFGGGTPILVNPSELGRIIHQAKILFLMPDDSEITLEANPCATTIQNLTQLYQNGVNRISFGMQSANEKELKALGRTHNIRQVKQAVKNAKRAGFENISVDIMLGVPFQTQETLKYTIDFLAELEIQHISAYMLKVEPNTPFAGDKLIEQIPEEDLVSDLYLFTCEQLEKLGFFQYEISNFAKQGFACKHNLKYWKQQEYLAFGPSAHGFWNGKRYFYPRDIKTYINTTGDNWQIAEDNIDILEEYLLLGLRLSEGICVDQIRLSSRVNWNQFQKKVYLFEKHGFLKQQNHAIFLTPKGFLLSNIIIGELIMCIRSDT